MDEVLDAQAQRLAITRRIAGDIKELWGLQARFDKRTGRAPYRLIEHPKFRAAWDFLHLRAQAGSVPEELPAWWDRFAHTGHSEREELLRTASTGSDKPRKRRRSRRKSVKTIAPESTPEP
jgi:poly(A) polymerase